MNEWTRWFLKSDEGEISLSNTIQTYDNEARDISEWLNSNEV